MTEPTRLTAADFDPRVLVLFDAYVHGDLDRRGFLDRAARLTAGATAAAALLATLSPDFARAQQVAPDDARLETTFVGFDAPAGHGRGRAYLVRPARAAGPLPVVLVAHENRGLNPHIEDVSRRLALEGFIALAPDALFPRGGYPGDEDAARREFGHLDQAKAREDFVAAAAFARSLPGGNGRLGAVGFCWGGAIVNLLAVRVPELAAAVPFYGGPAPLDLVDRVRAELLVVMAGNDPRINDAWPPYEAALKSAGIRHTAHTYPGTQHGFHNDTTPRYDAAAAADAWNRTLTLFRRRLGA